ncbi:MAG: dTDP-glucose 4,6-dehydratase [Anaerolineae bacterium]|jgi:dTDP-glucose 4,6-dehydratase|nr:dTDP-glucose 4,6-dehydratase [Anaerolineae bacterium]
MRRLMVTGGAGFIGSNFVRHMLEKYPDYFIVVYDKLTYAGRLENLEDVAARFEGRYAFAKGDICDTQTVEEAVQSYAIDTIVNFAAETHVDRSLVEPGSFIQTDVYGTFVLLEAAKKFGLERYHQIGTDEVYGQVLENRSKETDPLEPRSPYSASKAGGDLMALAYYQSWGVPVTITRGSNNVGPYQYPEKVVPLFATNAIDDQPLPVYGDGQQMRDYQYVIDHCEGIDLVLHKGTIGEVYNVGTGSEMTNLEMTQIVLETLGKPASLIQHVEDRPGHDRRYALDVTKLGALGWKSGHTCAQAVEKTVRWYAENEAWWRPIKSGGLYKTYYQEQYGKRLADRP